jgi:hypothetical protein
MKLLRTSFLTALGLAVVGLALSLTYQKGVEAQVGSTPVRVVNLATAPALARDVDRHEPYHQGTTLFAGGLAVVLRLPTVPAGKRLVIEYVAVQAAVPFGQQVQATLFNGPEEIPLEVPFQGRGTFLPVPNFDVHVGSQRVLAFVDAGTSPSVVFSRNVDSLGMDVRAYVSGYLVDL